MKSAKLALIDLMVEIFTDLLHDNVNKHRKLSEQLLAVAVYVLTLLPPLSYDLRRYPDRRAKVLGLRLGLDADGQVRSQVSVAELLGVTPERVRQIQEKALRMLRWVVSSNQDVLFANVSEMIPKFEGEDTGKILLIGYEIWDSINCAVRRLRAEEHELPESTVELVLRHAWLCRISGSPISASKEQLALALYAMCEGHSDEVDKLQTQS